MTKKIGSVFILALCAGCILLGSCQRSLSMWVVPGSTSDDMVFGLAESREREEKVRPQSIMVFTCEEMKKGKGEMPSAAHSLWHASAPTAASATPASRITYGRDEHGLTTLRGPSPLVAGCYAVVAYAQDQRNTLRVAGMRFEIERDGAVVGK